MVYPDFPGFISELESAIFDAELAACVMVANELIRIEAQRLYEEEQRIREEELARLEQQRRLDDLARQHQIRLEADLQWAVEEEERRIREEELAMMNNRNLMEMEDLYAQWLVSEAARLDELLAMEEQYRLDQELQAAQDALDEIEREEREEERRRIKEEEKEQKEEDDRRLQEAKDAEMRRLKLLRDREEEMEREKQEERKREEERERERKLRAAAQKEECEKLKAEEEEVVRSAETLFDLRRVIRLMAEDTTSSCFSVAIQVVMRRLEGDAKDVSMMVPLSASMSVVDELNFLPSTARANPSTTPSIQCDDDDRYVGVILADEVGAVVMHPIDTPTRALSDGKCTEMPQSESGKLRDLKSVEMDNCELVKMMQQESDENNTPSEGDSGEIVVTDSGVEVYVKDDINARLGSDECSEGKDEDGAAELEKSAGESSHTSKSSTDLISESMQHTDQGEYSKAEVILSVLLTRLLGLSSADRDDVALSAAQLLLGHTKLSLAKYVDATALFVLCEDTRVKLFSAVSIPVAEAKEGLARCAREQALYGESKIQYDTVCMYVCMYVRVCVCMYVCMYVYVLFKR